MELTPRIAAVQRIPFYTFRSFGLTCLFLLIVVLVLFLLPRVSILPLPLSFFLFS